MKAAMQAPTRPRRLSPQLQLGGVDIWIASLDLPPGEEFDRLRAVLSADELERAGRFHFVRDWRRFIVGRGRLRTILGDCIGAAPRALAFRYGANEKPELGGEFAGSGWRFNVSHSDGLVAIAVSAEAEVGIDVERVRDIPEWLEISERLFPAPEFARLCATAEEQRMAEFFHIWTRTEARLKAIGDGFGTPQSQPRHHRGTTVALHSFTPVPGFAGALAILSSSDHS